MEGWGGGGASAGLAVRLPLKDPWEKRGGGGVERGGGKGGRVGDNLEGGGGCIGSKSSFITVLRARLHKDGFL